MESAQEGKEDCSGVLTRSSVERFDHKEERCFGCDEPACTAGLHNASINDIDMKVHRCAI